MRYYRRSIIQDLVAPIVKTILWICSAIYQIAFGWVDVSLSKKRRKELEIDVRKRFAFLFSGHAAGLLVPNIGISSAEPFDYATVTIAYGKMLIRIARGREEFTLELARSDNPLRWYDLVTIVTAVNGKIERPDRRWLLGISEAAKLLDENMLLIYGKFGSDLDSDVESRLAQFDNADRASKTRWEFEVNKHL